jgi:hypothetical protein
LCAMIYVADQLEFSASFRCGGGCNAMQCNAMQRQEGEGEGEEGELREKLSSPKCGI